MKESMREAVAVFDRVFAKLLSSEPADIVAITHRSA